MRFPDYALNEYQALNNPRAKSRLGAASLQLKSLADLLSLADAEQREEWDTLTLSYAPERGSEALRTEIASHYPGLTHEDIAVFSSATEALFCAIHAAVDSQDRCTVITPCYEPLAKIPQSLGARVSEIALRNSEEAWHLDTDAVIDATRTSNHLFINFPHNPTGAMITQEQLGAITAACEKEGTRLFSDEVFRGLEHVKEERLTPAASLSERGISIGSVAKPHGVGGVRIGWIATRDAKLINRSVEIRRTLSVCSGTTDEWLATLVLSHSQGLREKSLATLKANLQLIESTRESLAGKLIWTPPQAGCAAFPLIRVDHAADAMALAKDCLEKTGIMLIPSHCFVGGSAAPFQHGVRLGYGLDDFADTWNRFADYLGR